MQVHKPRPSLMINRHSLFFLSPAPSRNIAPFSQTRLSQGIGLMPTRNRRRNVSASRPPHTVARTGKQDASEPQNGHMVMSGVASAALYIRDVLQTALRLLKQPLGALAFLLASGLLLNFVLGIILSPLCNVPGISTSMFCLDPALGQSSEVRGPRSADFLKLVELQDGFKDVLDANVGTNEIGMKLKQSEMATRDLITLVRVSDLNSREALTDALMQFVDDAKRTGEGLHKLSAKIDGAVDRYVM